MKEKRKKKKRLGAEKLCQSVDELVNFSIFILPFSSFARGLDSMSLLSSSSLPFANAFFQEINNLRHEICFFAYAYTYLVPTYIALSLLLPSVFTHVTSPWVKSIKSHATIWCCRYSPVPIDECNNQICIFTENCAQ